MIVTRTTITRIVAASVFAVVANSASSLTWAEASAKDSKKCRQVLFPSHSLGRLYDIKAGADWVRSKTPYGQFFGTAANRIEVPQAARLALELDATVVDEPKLLESLAPDALFSLRVRRAEPTDNLLKSLYHLTGLRRLDFLDCDFSDKAVSGLVCLSQLERLSVNTCGLKGDCFSDLAQLKKLKYLSANNNMLNRNACPSVAQMPALLHLELARTQLVDADLFAISKLSKLETLNINSNSAFTAKGFLALKSLKKLDTLLVQNTAMKVTDLLALKGLPLQKIWLPALKVRPSEMQALHKAFPNCEILIQSHDAGSDYDVIFAPVTR
jgi:hypothetical protein